MAELQYRSPSYSRRASNGLKDNMPSKSSKSRRPTCAKNCPRGGSDRRFSRRDPARYFRSGAVFANCRRSNCRRGYALSIFRRRVTGANGRRMMVDTVPISTVRSHQVDTLIIPGGPGIWALRQDPTWMNGSCKPCPGTADASVSRRLRVGLDGRAGWQARRDPLAILSEAAGQFSRHPGRANAILFRTEGCGHPPASAPASTSRLR